MVESFDFETKMHTTFHNAWDGMHNVLAIYFMWYVVVVFFSSENFHVHSCVNGKALLHAANWINGTNTTVEMPEIRSTSRSQKKEKN